MKTLAILLGALDPQAPLAQRHLWLAYLLDWIRGDRVSPLVAVQRLDAFLDALEARPDIAAKLREWLLALVREVDLTPLLADFGFAPRISFASELAERLRRKWLPTTPETHDAAELFPLLLRTPFDAQWLLALEAPQLQRLTALLSLPPQAGAVDAPAPDTPAALPPRQPLPYWQATLMDAITFCTGHIQATGFAPELRLRMDPALRRAETFQALDADVQALRSALEQYPLDAEPVQAAAQQLRERIDTCRQAVATIYGHLEDNGISVGLVFRLRQLRERMLRVRDLVDCLLSQSPAASTAKLFARLAIVGQERRSLRALIASNSSLLAAKVAERSAETGEHYITRDAREYWGMVKKAGGGGMLTAGTVILKFLIGWLGLSLFWNGFWSGVMYAASFVAIQLLHCTLATKQPAMTAPAMAAKLKDLSPGGAVNDFVDEVTHLVRTQVAAVLGNVVLVIPSVLLLCIGLQYALGHPLLDAATAEHVFHSLDIRGGTLIFAAFTGTLLFSASIIAGWVENWFVLHRLDSALRYNPRITAVLGVRRAARWAIFMRTHISGFASNIALGLMLGLVPAFTAFFGLNLEARHVTLSTGQIAAAAATYGLDAIHMHALWWCAVSIPFVGALNLVVSFFLAFRLALRAHNVSGSNRTLIRKAILQRLRLAPLEFLLPIRKRTRAGG